MKIERYFVIGSSIRDMSLEILKIKGSWWQQLILLLIGHFRSYIDNVIRPGWRDRSFKLNYHYKVTEFFVHAI